ncbi:MAG: DNA ligase, partial [bacterium]|nr:DNA ligase [bacterium]
MTFSELSHYFKRLEDTASRNIMVEILAELFRRSGADEIGNLCYLLQGRIAPLFEPLEFGIADKFMIRAIALAYASPEVRVKKDFQELGDLGIAAETLASTNQKKRETSPTVPHVFTRLYALARESGQGSQEKKIAMLAELLSVVDPLS